MSALRIASIIMIFYLNIIIVTKSKLIISEKRHENFNTSGTNFGLNRRDDKTDYSLNKRNRGSPLGCQRSSDSYHKARCVGVRLVSFVEKNLLC